MFNINRCFLVDGFVNYKVESSFTTKEEAMGCIPKLSYQKSDSWYEILEVVETFKIEMSAGQRDMIIRALYSHRLRGDISQEESNKYEDLADKIGNIKTFCETKDGIFVL